MLPRDWVIGVLCERTKNAASCAQVLAMGLIDAIWFPLCF
jgi:hypothetical protein